MNIPMLPKYVDESQPDLFEFGTYPDGNVDLSDGNRDVFVNIPPATAVAIRVAQGEYKQRLYDLLCKKEA